MRWECTMSMTDLKGRLVIMETNQQLINWQCKSENWLFASEKSMAVWSAEKIECSKVTDPYDLPKVKKNWCKYRFALHKWIDFSGANYFSDNDDFLMIFLYRCNRLRLPYIDTCVWKKLAFFDMLCKSSICLICLDS